MTSSVSSWITARKVAGVEANSLPKRRVSELVSSSNQSSLGDTAVAAKSAQQDQAGYMMRGGEVDVVVEFPTQRNTK